MNILALLILGSLAVATTFLVAFIWAVRSGQYEDTSTPAMRFLPDDPAPSGSHAVSPPKQDKHNP